MMCDEKDYNLTVEILEANPHSATLKKGQTCRAMVDPGDPDGLCVFDEKSPLSGPWMIDADEAKVIKNG